MAWGYWNAAAIDRGRSPRRSSKCMGSTMNSVTQCGDPPPVPTCYSPCRSHCSSPCHSPCPDSPCQESIPSPPQGIQNMDEYCRRASPDSPQVNNNIYIYRYKCRSVHGIYIN